MRTFDTNESSSEILAIVPAQRYASRKLKDVQVCIGENSQVVPLRSCSGYKAKMAHIQTKRSRVPVLLLSGCKASAPF